MSREALFQVVTRDVLRSDPEFKIYGHNNSERQRTDRVDIAVGKNGITVEKK